MTSDGTTTAEPSDADEPEAPDVLVLRRGTHGMPSAEYVAALRERLPDRSIAHARTPAAERRLIQNATVATGVAIDDALLERADDLEAFMAIYAGADHLPLERLRERGIAVTTASGVHGSNVAEHAIGGLLSIVRGFDVARRQADRREYRHFQADELHGERVAIVGLGPIGRAIADRLDAFGVETVGVRYTPSKGGPTDTVVGFDDLHGALDDSRAVVLACPLTDATRGLIDRAAFETLPPDAVLVNVARGPVVDTDALCWALRRNELRGAALDVTDPEPLPPDHPLWTFENVLLTPHNAGHTPAYFDRLADIVAENVRALAAGRPLRNQVVPAGEE